MNSLLSLQAKCGNRYSTFKKFSSLQNPGSEFFEPGFEKFRSLAVSD
ncbi:hypothetical protein K9L27_01150 [Candidatus Gracilibacteria bacterium]|nr:hypothetical protein [Candidatus Gracilibacteria bacterium]